MPLRWFRPEPIVYYPMRSPATSIIIAMHGFTESAAKMQAYASIQQMADALNCMIVYINAMGHPPNWINRPTPFPNRDFAYIDEVLATYAVGMNPSRVFLLGFSDGAYMANFYAVHHDTKIGKVVSYAGRLTQPQPIQTTNKFPVMIIHGVDDKAVNEDKELALKKQYEDAKHPVTYRVARYGHHYDQSVNIPDMYNFLAA